MNYFKVTYASDYLDPKPIIKTFLMNTYEMEVILEHAMKFKESIEFQTQHSPFYQFLIESIIKIRMG